MKFFSIAALAACLTAVSAKEISGNSGLSYCKGDGSNYLLDLSHLSVTPNPPVKGQNVKVTAKGHSHEKLERGTNIEVTFKKGVFSKSKSKGICEGANMKCPSRELDFEFEEMVKEKVPSGDYDVEVRVKGARGKELVCLKGEMKL